MIEYLVQHWSLIHKRWMNEVAFFRQEDAHREVGNLYQEFPYEKFRILKCEPLEQQS